jgi:hypothetical protein
MRPSLLVLSIAISILAPESVTAQRLEDARVAAAPVHPPADSARQRREVSRFEVITGRSFTALVGMAAGGYAGFELGGYYTPVTERDTYVASNAEMVGILIGGVVGTAAGAAFPAYGSSCSFSKRFWRGMRGAALGFLPGLALGPLGPAVGAALGQGRC